MTIGHFLKNPSQAPTAIAIKTFLRAKDTKRKIVFITESNRYTYEKKTGYLYGGKYARPKGKIGRPETEPGGKVLCPTFVMTRADADALNAAIKRAKAEGEADNKPPLWWTRGEVIGRALRIVYAGCYQP